MRRAKPQTQYRPIRRSTGHIAALDGLRFVAAFFVVGGHYMTMESEEPLSAAIATLPTLGMTLFFVLSGFVIHYNYGQSIGRPGGIRSFAIARFARLYPLYIFVILIAFSYEAASARGACGSAGVGWLGLGYYLTLTQSWTYAVICHTPLIFAYGPIAAVTWSISVELFFYLIYVGLGPLIYRQRWSAKILAAIAGTAFAAFAACFAFCVSEPALIEKLSDAIFGPVNSVIPPHTGSLTFFLLYFNPLARLGEFLAGVAAAHFVLRDHRPWLSGKTAPFATTLVALSVILIHTFVYGANLSPLARSCASPFAGPSLAAFIYLTSRYASFWSYALSRPLLIRLGEASYSIYLLHEFFPSALKRMGVETTDVRLASVIAIATLGALLISSRCLYIYFERPARNWFRERFKRSSKEADGYRSPRRALP